jgi:hypothetical protein
MEVSKSHSWESGEDVILDRNNNVTQSFGFELVLRNEETLIMVSVLARILVNFTENEPNNAQEVGNAEHK